MSLNDSGDSQWPLQLVLIAMAAFAFLIIVFNCKTNAQVYPAFKKLKHLDEAEVLDHCAKPTLWDSQN